MKNEVLEALAATWIKDSETPKDQVESDGMKIPNAVNQGIREGKRECADCLVQLMTLIKD